MRHSADCIYHPGQEAKPPKPGAKSACCKAAKSYVDRRAQRRHLHNALTDMGMRRVKGNLGGTYYE